MGLASITSAISLLAEFKSRLLSGQLANAWKISRVWFVMHTSCQLNLISCFESEVNRLADWGWLEAHCQGFAGCLLAPVLHVLD